MDDQTKLAYIRIGLEKAHDDLRSARDLTVNSHLRGAVNRAYYTMFHAASSALLWLGIERVRHSGIQSAFGEYLVKPGIIETEFSRMLSEARKVREDQDYDYQAVPLTAQKAEQIVHDADQFLLRMERYLKEAGAVP